MIKIQRFPFNDFQVNTYVVYDETNECIIVDPGMYYEKKRVVRLYANSFLKRFKTCSYVNTHAHIDHIIANDFVAIKYNIKLAAHKESKDFLTHAQEYGRNFGIQLDKVKPIDLFIDEGNIEIWSIRNYKFYILPAMLMAAYVFIPKKRICDYWRCALLSKYWTNRFAYRKL